MHLEELVIVDYVEGALDAAARAQADHHLEICAECRQLIEDFQDIHRTARSLELREPPARAWARIERAIAVEQQEQGARGLQPSDRSDTARLKASRSLSRSQMTWLAAAAVLVLATIAGIRYVAGTRTGVPADDAVAHSDTAPAAQVSAATVEAELRAAESHYDKAIKGLEHIASTEQGALDPNTAATLQKNLAVIDQAISESRAAVIAQPASEPARESLMESFRTKLALLQDTVALINEMRKGNEAGAARVVSGLKQKGD